MRSGWLVAGAVCAVLAAAPPAYANGRFPASNRIVFSPSNEKLVVLRTTFGILPSYDNGTTWSWLCEDVLGLPPTSNEDPSLEITKNNSLVVGVSHGLLVSPDTGCTWVTEDGGLTQQLIKDLDIPPQSPDTVLAITSTFEQDAGPDGGQGYFQQIFTSTDDGAHWALTGTIDPSATVTTIDVAPGDSQRIYVSAYRGSGATRTTSIFVSGDGGQTWAEYPTPFDASSETAVYIGAVDPTNEDRLYVRSEGASRLFVSSDGGKTYQVAFSLNDQMLGFALSQDGSKVYLGGPNTGLYVASSTDLQFSSVKQEEPDGSTRTIHVQCLATHGTDLWACSDEVSGFVAGVSQDDGVTFTPKLHLLGIQGPLSCPAGTDSTICTTTNDDAAIPYNPFGSLCTNLGACYGEDAAALPEFTVACNQFGACGPQPNRDAGSPPANDAGSPVTTGGSGSPAKASCGCSFAGGGGAAGALLAAGVAALAVRRRRRR